MLVTASRRGFGLQKSIGGSIFTDPTVGDGLCHVRRFVVYERSRHSYRAEPLLSPQGDKSKESKTPAPASPAPLKPTFRARCHFFSSLATGPLLLTQGHTQLVYARLKLCTQAPCFVKTISSQWQSAGKETLTTTPSESHYMHGANGCYKRCCHFEQCSHSLGQPEVPARCRWRVVAAPSAAAHPCAAAQRALSQARSLLTSVNPLQKVGLSG